MFIPDPLDRAGYRKFGLVFSLMVALVFGLFLPWLFDRTPSLVPVALAAGVAAWALIHPASLHLLYRPWMVLAHYLGIINSKIILTLAWGLTVVPTGIIMKLLRKDPMQRRLQSDPDHSYWQESEVQDRERMEEVY